MVGAERAVAELDHFIRTHETEKAAAEAIGCAVSTLKKLKKQFAQVGDEALAPVALALAQGEQLRGREDVYEVEDRLGSGGMGVVYRVRRVEGGDTFAAKILSSERFAMSNVVRSRFVRESQLAATFQSMRVVRSVECLHHRGTLVSIMELLSGATLYDQLQASRSTLSPIQRYRWLEQVVQGVAYLHENNIVHRELSPRNCLLRADGSLAVGDFGVARRMDDATITTFHERMGSLIYISPQQRENPHAGSFVDDVYAIGQIAYHLLTGRSPHRGTEHVEDLGYPIEIDEWVTSLRDPEPHRRPRTAGDALTLLTALDIDDDFLPMFLP
jgi:serine/threonine-protein kinase